MNAESTQTQTLSHHNYLQKVRIAFLLLTLFFRRNQRKILLETIKIHKKDSLSVVFTSMWLGVGDICNTMALLPFIFAQYGRHHVYFVATRDKWWLFEQYDIEYSHMIFVSDKNTAGVNDLRHVEIFAAKPLTSFFGLMKPIGIHRLGNEKKLRSFTEILSYGLFGRIEKPIPLMMPWDCKANRSKTILVNTLSNSASIDSTYFWQIESFAIARGYKIIYNLKRPERCTGEVFAGSLIEFRKMCFFSKLVVSVRSGLLDYIMTSRINILCIYPTNDFLDLWTFSQYDRDYRGDIVEVLENDFKTSWEKHFTALLNGS